MSDDECGVEQGNGKLCDNPVKYADGKCGVHTGVTDSSPGRPTKFNDERARLAIGAALEGKSVAGCERAAGVGQKTIGGWLEQNHTFETDEGLIADFSQAFAQARARGESWCIRNARREDGDASFEKFMLASSYDYKKTERVEADVDQTTTHELADDDRDAALKAIRTRHA
jgi:hypothetical protein